MTNEINECCLDEAVRGLNAHQLGGQFWETPNLESQRRMPVDVKTSLWTHLDTWLGWKARTSPPSGARVDAGDPRSPKTTAPRTLSTRGTYKQTHPDTWNTEEKQ